MPEPAPEFEIRPAADGDLDAIVDLLWAVAAEGRWIGAEAPFDRPARRRRYAELVAADPDSATLLVAVSTRADHPAVIGSISVDLAPYGVADLSMMVADGWRGRGLGRALLEAGMAWAERAGAHKMWLEVWPHNTPAIALYERAGFVEEGRKRAHYRRRNGELWDAVMMGRPLPRTDRSKGRNG